MTFARERPTIHAEVPRSAIAVGLRVDPAGTHLSSTLKLDELRVVLGAIEEDASLEALKRAVVESNVLGKPTASSRRITFDRLRELYGLDRSLLVFRALRDLWSADQDAQPMLALLCATARDPILRAVTPMMIATPVGTPLSVDELAEEAERQFPGKFVPSSLARLGRNIASSWEKAGLLAGRRDKIRNRPEIRPTSLAYALLLGDLCGRRGQALFGTLWALMLGAPVHEMKEMAVQASQQGWIEYRAMGDVVEVSFRHLMREETRNGP